MMREIIGALCVASLLRIGIAKTIRSGKLMFCHWLFTGSGAAWTGH